MRLQVSDGAIVYQALKEGLHTSLSEIHMGSFTDIGLLYIHRFIYIHLMKGHVAGGATFHQGVLLGYLH